MIKELQNLTTNQKEAEGLSLGHDKFESVVAIVNDMTRKIENRDIRIDLLSSIEAPFDLPLEDQVLLKKGKIFLDTGYRLKERYAILFGKVLLICKHSKQGYTLDSGYMISDLEMPNEPKGNIMRESKGPRCFIHLYIISENLTQLSLVADSEQSRNEWIKCFEQAFELVFDDQAQDIVLPLDLDLKRMRRNAKARNTVVNSTNMKIRKKVSLN